MGRGVKVAVVACGGALVLAAAFPREGAPARSLERAKAAVARARDAQAPRFAPGPYAEAVELLERAKIEAARQRGRLPLFRSYRRADSLCVAAQREAASAEISALAFVSARLRALDARSEQARKELESWRRTLDGSLTIHEAERAYALARLSFQKARALLAERDFDAAEEAFARVDSAIAGIVRTMDRYAYERSERVEQWRDWVRQTVERSVRTRAPAIIVDKRAHTLYVVHSGAVVRTYRCDLGYNSAGQKTQEGDGATPEGMYRICGVLEQGSTFYKALRLDYPNAADRARFEQNRRNGVVSPQARIGGLIEIHGHGGLDTDWTEGCIALSNEDMDDLIRRVGVGTPVTIVRESDQWP